jgi:nitrogen-specific signal transduction histidine kinase/CheY-like chemotaxis protein
VTQQRETERRLRQSQKMEAVGQLTGGLAHDFNNILQVAGVTLDWLGQAIQGDERLEQRVETALLAVERGSTLTRQLLTFAREQQLESEIAAPNKLVEDARALLKQTLPEDIELTIELAPEAPAIKVDVGMFDNALINLALNARDAMPDGGALTISTRRKTYQGETADSDGEAIYGAYVVVSLRDTGSGIDENNLKKVLEPFYTTKGVGRGTGLGLSMVYGFVHQCGGYLLIASELGKGTEISLLFPAIAGNAAACGPAAVDARRAVAEGEGTVLLVEDDELVRMSVNEMLTELGYTVIEAVNGQAALDQLEAAQRSEHPIDVILSDIVMPGDISGLDLVDIIKAEYPDMKLVLTSGYSNRFGEFGNNGNGDNSGGVGSGGPKDIAFLRKPFKVKDLAETLRKTLDPSPPPVKPNLERSLEEELFAL